MFTQKIWPTKISPKIFTQKNFHPKNFTQKKCSLKKCSPNKFSPKKIFTQKFCRINKFFTESVRLSFVDLRWAQLYVSLVPQMVLLSWCWVISKGCPSLTRNIKCSIVLVQIWSLWFLRFFLYQLFEVFTVVADWATCFDSNIYSRFCNRHTM